MCMCVSVYVLAYLSVHLALCFYLRTGIALAGALTVLRLLLALLISGEWREKEAEEAVLYVPTEGVNDRKP